VAVGGAPNTPPNGPPPSQIQTSPNLVHFDPKQVVPSQPIYVQRNDSLMFFYTTNGSNMNLRCNYRWLTPDGEIKEGEFDTAPFTGTAWTFIPLYEGWLLSFAARITTGGAAAVWTFLQVKLVRNYLVAGASLDSAIIWQGFVPQNTSNGWPGTPSKEIGDGPGVIRSITGTLPAAGAEISEQVPLNRRWTLLSLYATLATAVAVANRQPVFKLTFLGSTLFLSPSYINQPASQTQAYVSASVFASAAPNVGGFALLLPLPLPIRNATTIQTLTTGIQAADQWTAPQYTVLEWGVWDG
jgi:hypothetical protein